MATSKLDKERILGVFKHYEKKGYNVALRIIGYHQGMFFLGKPKNHNSGWDFDILYGHAQYSEEDLEEIVPGWSKSFKPVKMSDLLLTGFLVFNGQPVRDDNGNYYQLISLKHSENGKL